MRDEDRNRTAELMSVAARLSAAARDAFLLAAEPARADLRDEVRSLLAHDEGRAELGVAAFAAPRNVGVWEILDPLGDAPPARLYRARHRGEPQRGALVALLASPVAGPAVARALSRQARAQRDLSHPRLARLLEAGAPDADWLFAAFEVIDGVPMAELCDALRLGLAERMTLIEEAARIVAHAHAAGLEPLGVLPWSVLATWDSAGPRAALLAIDPWPLLAVLDPDARPRRGLLAALETAPPEALAGGARGAHTDVFSLGALAFELATGTPPLGLRRLAGARSLREELRLASRISVPLASRRVTSLGDAGSAAAELRATSWRELASDLEQGLDQVLARALADDPAARVRSATEFADALAAWREVHLAGRGLLGAARGLARRMRRQGEG